MITKILLIYTGGTIGMKQDPNTMAYVPFNFEQLLEEVPEIRKFKCEIETYSFEKAIDSSDVQPDFWIRLVEIIEQNYKKYDAFVILHGTDTMAYTASALSFMLENLSKPIVLTGAQLPIGVLRTDGKENLISAIEIASQKNEDGSAKVPEVCVFFEAELFRGNRIKKYSAENFNAFKSPNYPSLAEAGVHIKYKTKYIEDFKGKNQENDLIVHKKLDTNVAIIKIFPGISENNIKAIINMPNIRAIILEAYGSGNAPRYSWFIEAIKDAINKGIIIINVSQCNIGLVNMSAYATGLVLKEAGVTSGADLTTEAAICKTFFLLAKYSDNETIKQELEKNLRGEVTKLY